MKTKQVCDFSQLLFETKMASCRQFLFQRGNSCGNFQLSHVYPPPYDLESSNSLSEELSISLFNASHILQFDPVDIKNDRRNFRNDIIFEKKIILSKWIMKTKYNQLMKTKQNKLMKTKYNQACLLFSLQTFYINKGSTCWPFCLHRVLKVGLRVISDIMECFRCNDLIFINNPNLVTLRIKKVRRCSILSKKNSFSF